MISLPPAPDDEVDALLGAALQSPSEADVTYTMTRIVGRGRVSVAFLALRAGPDGETPVVLKVMRPSAMRHAGEHAALRFKKEATALSRLNEQVPSTPYVVRLIDAGEVAFDDDGEKSTLPWMALELVLGGAQGTTLEARVATSMRTTGHAFEPSRAQRALSCIAQGLSAVHAVGVIHRDLSPRNVLCCGSGADEMFKLVDFGLARPLGMQATFKGGVVGSVRYAAPELSGFEPESVGPQSDVFSLAAIIYFILAGEDLFQPRTSFEEMMVVAQKHRRSLLDAAGLSSDMRLHEPSCRAIDAIIALATSVTPIDRPPSAEALAGMVLPHLREARSRPSRNVMVSFDIDVEAKTELATWSWMRRHTPLRECAVRNASFDGDGRAMAATSRGLLYWSGERWAELRQSLLPRQGTRFTVRWGAGKWLVGGDGPTLLTCSSEGVAEAMRHPDPLVRFSAGAGSPDDGVVLVGVGLARTPALYAYIDGAFSTPIPLADVSSITTLCHVGPGRFLLAGRKRSAGAFASLYEVGAKTLTPLRVPPVRALLACAASHPRGEAYIVGTDGVALTLRGHHLDVDFSAPRVDLSCIAVDPAGFCWASGEGEVWLRKPGPPTTWVRQPIPVTPRTPVIAASAGPQNVLFLAAEGELLEGQSYFARR